MKPFNLEEYLANPSRKVVTRDGNKVRIICTDRLDEDYPIIALVKVLTDVEWCENFTTDGRNSKVRKESDFDLFFATEKHEGWFNIYHSDESGFYVRQNHPYKSKDEADKVAKANHRTFFATVKIEWEE